MIESPMNEYLQFSEKVIEAVNKNTPIIALESTIISHGLPYPLNVETALRLEKLAEDNGVTPATICLMKGKIKIGLEPEEIETLGKSKNVEKVSRRDLGRVIVNKKMGSTTVAATMIAAYNAGIDVFATGGIGGVHRNAENTFDISADLFEFKTSPVIVVSAGVKAILDIPKTLEYLETLGVPVFGYKTDKFPAFYTSETNYTIPQVKTPEEIAEIHNINKELGIKTGLLATNPIPKEFEIPSKEIEIFIQQALKKARISEISGKDLTPFLLSELAENTEGKSVKSNLKLVENNVLLACSIAKAL